MHRIAETKTTLRYVPSTKQPEIPEAGENNGSSRCQQPDATTVTRAHLNILSRETQGKQNYIFYLVPIFKYNRYVKYRSKRK